MSCLDVFNASNLVLANQDTILAADIPFFFDRISYIGDASLAGKQARFCTHARCRKAGATRLQCRPAPPRPVRGALLESSRCVCVLERESERVGPLTGELARGMLPQRNAAAC